MEQTKGRFNLTLALFPFVFVALGLLLLYNWYTEQKLYLSARNISAVISQCRLDIDTDDYSSGKDYDVYVDYTFNGETYTDVFWRSFSKRQEIGQTVTVQVSPARPNRTISNPAPAGAIGVIMTLTGVGLVFKVAPMAFGDKHRHPRRTPEERRASRRTFLPVILVFGTGAAVFIVLGICLSPYCHIGSIVLGYVTILLIDNNL